MHPIKVAANGRQAIPTPKILPNRNPLGKGGSVSADNLGDELQSLFLRIRTISAVLNDRVRGKVSKNATQQILGDAEAGLSLLSRRRREMGDAASTSPVVQEPSFSVSGALADQPNIASMIRMLLELLADANGESGGDALRAAIEAVEDLAVALGVTEQASPSPDTASRESDSQAWAYPRGVPHQESSESSEEEFVGLADAIGFGGEPVTDEELLHAVNSALALHECSQAVSVSLEGIQRRVGHCELLFEHIAETAERGCSTFLIGQFAEIGRDIATEVQDECLSLLRLLEDEGREENHG